MCSAAREALGRPRGEERGGGILCRHAHSLFCDVCLLQSLFLACFASLPGKKIAAVDVSEVVHLLNKEYVTTVIQDVLFRVAN